MKRRDLFDSAGNVLLPKVPVNMDDVDPDDRDELAGMRRGLMCATEALELRCGLMHDRFVLLKRERDNNTGTADRGRRNPTRFNHEIRMLK